MNPNQLLKTAVRCMNHNGPRATSWPFESQPSPGLLFPFISWLFATLFCFFGRRSDDYFITGQTEITWLETFLSLALSWLSPSVPWPSSRSIISQVWLVGYLSVWLFSIYFFWKAECENTNEIVMAKPLTGFFLFYWIFSEASRLSWLIDWLLFFPMMYFYAMGDKLKKLSHSKRIWATRIS